MKLFSLQCLLLAAVSASALSTGRSEAPKVTIKNGTLVGAYSAGYDQDFFLGVPYAQPPVGGLRFRRPQPLNTPWSGELHAQSLSASCVGYGPSQWGYNVSEDCLYLNVVRPAGTSMKKPLPVLAWIHGGGFVQGAGSDLRYNLSFIVERSVTIGQPIIAVSLNYRLSAWGFLSSKEVLESGDTNLGLRDQRLFLHWIQENIAAFGGDPKKVTIWGQSAGAMSVGRHLNAYNGRDDGLFRSAIMCSGNPTWDDTYENSTQSLYDSLVSKTGCGTDADSLECLRQVPFEKLNAVINTTTLINWGPQIDGDIIARPSKEQFKESAFVKVPIISGANTGEGTSFGDKGINTTEEFNASLPTTWSAAFKSKILEVYPEHQPNSALPNLPVDFVAPAYPWGKQWVREASFAGDNMLIASRRAVCEKWASVGLPAYCYRFNAIPAWSTPLEGATHFVENAFAMLNLDGVGYLPVRTPPFQGLGEEYRDLARLISSDFISFTASGDPNRWRGRSRSAKTLGKRVPDWPLYGEPWGRPNAQSHLFLYDGNVTSSTEPDIFRKAGIELLNSLN